MTQLTIIMSLIFSAHAALSVLCYYPPERSPGYKDARFPVNEDDGNEGTINRYLKVKQFDKDSSKIHHLLRDSLTEFESAATMLNWSKSKILKEFHANILVGKGIEIWD